MMLHLYLLRIMGNEVRMEEFSATFWNNENAKYTFQYFCIC